MKITGVFEVSINPLDPYAKGEDGINIGRMSMEKTFEGELNAVSKGEMLSAMTPVKESAGYVAIEQVTGSLSRKEGSFVLQNFGVIDRGSQRLVLEVIPDSGTEQLTGLKRKMTINIEKSQHYYEFDYELE